MAALGAAAGAFEGDNARAEQRADMARLSLQGAQLAQGDRQFDEQTKLARERMASAEAENAAQRRENADALALRQKNIDRQFAFDEKQFQAGRENDAYQRVRNERQDAWREALNAQEIMEKQERIKTNRLQFEELDRAAKMEREQLSNRQRLAKTGIGALALSALKNGGIAGPAQIEAFNKQQAAAGTGIRVTSGVWSKDGFAFKREGPAVDQNGQPIQGKMAEYDELMNPAIARAIIKDEFGEDIAEEQSSAQRESTRFNQQRSLAETKVLPEDRQSRIPRYRQQNLSPPSSFPDTALPLRLRQHPAYTAYSFHILPDQTDPAPLPPVQSLSCMLLPECSRIPAALPR